MNTLQTHPPAVARKGRALRRAFAAAVTVVAASALVLGTAVPAAHAEGRVSVTVVDRPDLVAVADPNYLTEVTLSGSGFQSIASGFGGVYVFFGWVAGGGWAPSSGGQTGSDYRYVYDDEENPVGYQLFVSFPGSSTEYAANGGTIAADGTWSATMKIPGSSFESYDRDGNVSTVDCLQLQCGIITIGAHGVANPSNESFTPIAFRDLYADDPDAAAAAAAEQEVLAAEAEQHAAEAQQGAPAQEPQPSSSVQAPAPVTTTIVAAAPAGDVDDDGLFGILLWAVAAVGVLALAAIGFLVWAVLSARRRGRGDPPPSSPPAAAGA
ncbi:hypothetical protein [Compostimonas suwonensis]|uniref:Htaa protein n=1 Tax=Compostimonas suwonensis TaxID=1048394 RepID=A0A2M9C4N4_9MICO|nr:hypothetical protein [Compostimonas suwonensis]PJJ65488.1 hypothetical protein CLV54_0521 [Compostimonas suwonensis]